MRNFKIRIKCPIHHNSQDFYIYEAGGHYFPTGCNIMSNDDRCKQCNIAIDRKYEYKDDSLFIKFFGE